MIPSVRVALCTRLDDLPFGRVHFDGGHSLFLTIDTKSQRPNGGFAPPAFGRISINAMPQGAPFDVQLSAGHQFLDSPLPLFTAAVLITLLLESKALNI